jgi:hypothetical protein
MEATVVALRPATRGITVNEREGWPRKMVNRWPSTGPTTVSSIELSGSRPQLRRRSSISPLPPEDEYTPVNEGKMLKLII